MADILQSLSMCLGGLTFILGTIPPATEIMSKYRERFIHAEKVKVRLGACQARFICWEGHRRLSRLHDRHGMSVDTFKDMEKLGATIYGRIDGSNLPEAQLKAWRKTKSKLRKDMFDMPRRFTEKSCNLVWWDLWSEGDLERWMKRLEKIIAAVNEIFNEDLAIWTDGNLETTLERASKLRDLETFASGLFELGNELHRRLTTESSISECALGLRPPEPSCDRSRWDVPVPIDVELRFWIDRKGHTYEQFRMHVSHRQHNKIETIKETMEHISEAKDPATTTTGCRPYKFTRCYKHDEHTEDDWSIGEMLYNGSAFSHDASWLIDRAGLGYAISQWSLLFWNTPWLEKFCCHGIFLDLATRSDECAHHIFRSKIHDDCRPGAEDYKIRNLGLAWAQLALGRPIRPASDSNIDFEIWSDDHWRTVQRDEINLEIIMATGSEPLQEAVNFCLRPDSQVHDEPLKASFLLECIQKMHEPIKAWYKAEIEYLKPRLAPFVNDNFIVGRDSMTESRVKSSSPGTIYLPIHTSRPKGKQRAVLPETGTSPKTSEHMTANVRKSTAEDLHEDVDN